MRSVLLLLAACTALHATPVATATCTVGSDTQTMTSATQAFCSLAFPAPGNWFIGAEAAVQRSFNADGTVQSLSVHADAGVNVPDTPPPASAYSSATDTEYFRSAGPPRAGSIAFVEQGYGNAGSSVTISDGVNQYSLYCDYFVCYSNGSWESEEGPLPPSLVPFELGTLFKVSLSAMNGGGCQNGDDCYSFGASLDSLQLFEADGTTPVSYSPVAVPEPGAGGLLLVAIAAALYGQRKGWIRGYVAAGSNSLLPG